MRALSRILIFVLFVGNVWAGAVRLVNDSAYKLRAVIRAADGTYLGEALVMPQKTTQWNDYWGGIGYYNQSQTPYTVVWFCLDGGGFSVCNNVPSGATVTAHSCDGTRACRPQKKKKGPPSSQSSPTEEYLENQELQQEAGPPEGQLQ